MKFAGSESLPRVEHFACGGFPSGMEHFHIRWIPFPAGVFCMRQIYRLPAGAFCMRQLYLLPAGAFCMRQVYLLPAGAFRMRQVYLLPAGAFCMRQVYLLPAGAFRMRQLRGGEAFIVAKAMLPSSRSTPPGHAAVLRCGMCCFAGEVMYSTVLVVVGCADMSGCSTVISLLTNTNTISHNLSIHITSYPPL